MEMADDKWKRQVDYLISMALMKEMRDEGIISKLSETKVIKKISDIVQESNAME